MAARMRTAKSELAKRTQMRRHLLPFVEETVSGYKAGWVHHDVCARLERFSQDIALQKSPRLMLFMPPRAGKSTLAAQCLPAWHLGHRPRDSFILASYGDTLARRHSRMARDIMMSPEYGRVFPNVSVNRQAQSVEEWFTGDGGGVIAAGVSTGITGKGGNLVIDDPHKDRKEADSPNIRDDVWDWYTSTAYTRLAPGGGVLLILTRWHEDDLAGRLLTAMRKGGEQWVVVNYKAIAEEDEVHRKAGEALHPERFDLKALERIRETLPARDWRALYQQEPTGDDGEHFKRADFRYHDRTETRVHEMRHYQAWDLAIGLEESHDFTVGVDVGVDEFGQMFAVDIVRGKWGSDGIVEQIIDFYERYRPEKVGIESGHIEKTMGPWLRRRMRERGATSLYIEELKTRGIDKLARAVSIKAAVQHGRITFPERHPGWETCIDEMIRFGGGGQHHDDQVDAMAWIGVMIDNMADRWKPRRQREGKPIENILAAYRKRRRKASKRSPSAMTA